MYLEQEAAFLTGKYKKSAWETKKQSKKHWKKTWKSNDETEI